MTFHSSWTIAVGTSCQAHGKATRPQTGFLAVFTRTQPHTQDQVGEALGAAA
jgi:hypothetical protein